MKHKIIKKVLMCEPLYFADLDYVINPWMQPGKIDKEKTMQQWNELVHAYQTMQIQVEIVKQQRNNPDMVFAADQGIVQGKQVLLSRFRYPERRGETKHYEKWFTEQGYAIKYLPEGYYFEGNGESHFWNDIFFVGTGYRSDKRSVKALGKLLDREVIALEIVDPAFYHLDTCLLPLNNRTVFYYPAAFSEKTKKTLQKHIPELIELSHSEAAGFAANSIVTDHHVVCQKGNKTFADKLNSLGYTAVEVDLSEFKKSGGGVHCLTNVLEEY